MTRQPAYGSYTRQRARCSFVPPFVIDHLAMDDREEVQAAALATAHQAMDSRARRAEQELTIDQLAASAGLEAISAAPSPTGQAAREVFNCEHRWVKRVDRVRREGADPTGDADADAAYDNVGVTRDFLKKALGRNSIDNLGLDLVLNVHYGVKFLNAFWDGEEMVFGDGDGTIFVGFAGSLDVVAHELGHGVTQFTANLNYEGQSGALNEHFSDVIGAVVTQTFSGETAETADWLIGNEIMGPDLQGEALRSMRAPGTAYDNPLMKTDPQPAHMSHYYQGDADNRGVHINSGIPNRAFYLVASELGDTLAAGQLWYRAFQRLTPTADFVTAAEVLASTARAMTKEGKLRKGAAQIVRDAFTEVGILHLEVAPGIRRYR
jgi:Zn-dependent metalloprotease